LGVEDLTDRTLLQNCKLIFSILDIHSKPHISEEDTKIGVTEKSNVSIEDLLECPNYYLFYKGHIELFELGIPISYNLVKNYHYN
jgi:hypothetical protein